MAKQLFGIDFGTTNSLAALVVGEEVRSLTNEEDDALIRQSSGIAVQM